MKEIAVVAMRLVLAVVVLAQSLIFLYGAESAQFLVSHGLPDVIRPVLGWSEIAFAILFLLPPTIAVGGWALLAVFCRAILLHLAHGQFEGGGLLLYSTAVLVVLAHLEPRQMNNKAIIS